jgi:hypothetical protein
MFGSQPTWPPFRVRRERRRPGRGCGPGRPATRARIAQTFAGYATVALANAHLYDTQATLANHLQAAMVSRAVIEQAKGIIPGSIGA